MLCLSTLQILQHSDKHVLWYKKRRKETMILPTRRDSGPVLVWNIQHPEEQI